MGIALEIFYLYRLETEEGTTKNVLIRATRSSFRNASQSLEDEAIENVEARRDALLGNYIGQSSLTETSGPKVEFLGEMQEVAGGEYLYGDDKQEIEIYYLETESGFPWIWIGQAKNQSDLIADVEEHIEDGFSIPKIETKQKLIVDLITET